MKIIIAGASGLVGNHFIHQIAQMQHIDAIYSIGRGEVSAMPSGAIHYKAPTQRWDEIIAELNADIACNCLGTTIKKAGSQEAFTAVDLELVRSFFTSAKNAGANHAISISSAMANAASKQFYLRTKGQAELAIKTLNFRRTDIIRPGLLRGERQNDRRLGENIALLASPLIDLALQGKYRKFRSIDAKNVAKAAALLSAKPNLGYFVHENDDILNLVKRS